MGFRRNLGGALARKYYELREGDTFISPPGLSAKISVWLRQTGGTGRGHLAAGYLHTIAMAICDGWEIKVKIGKAYYTWAGASETISKLRKLPKKNLFGQVEGALKYISTKITHAQRRGLKHRFVVISRKTKLVLTYYADGHGALTEKWIINRKLQNLSKREKAK